MQKLISVKNNKDQKVCENKERIHREGINKKKEKKDNIIRGRKEKSVYKTRLDKPINHWKKSETLLFSIRSFLCS